MSKIRIKNFGPIKEGYLENDGWMDVKKVTVFIGNQGSGKSTVAKLISTLTWMEKALTRGDYDKKTFEGKDVFRAYCEYHKIENYFNYPNRSDEQFDLFDNSEIEYSGSSYSIKYKSRHLIIEEQQGDEYPLPQIMYVPSDRNYISTVDDFKSQRLFSSTLAELLDEYQKAKKQIEDGLRLPINKADLEYDKIKDILYVKGTGYRVKLSEASSGFQSIVPLYLVSNFLANSIANASEYTREPMSSDELERFRKGIATIWNNKTLTDEQRRAALSVLSSKFNKTAFINIVEEPEQNLFPSSQRQMLNSLLGFNNMNDGNKLVITTHSPYLLVYLTLAVEAEKLKQKCNTENLRLKLAEIVPLESTVDGNKLVVYQLDENFGTIEKLKNYKGLPSDENKLNYGLAEANEEFSKLLDLEDLCQ